MEKEKRWGECEAGSERDETNQKQMLVHVWFSISKLSRDGAKCLWSPMTSPLISSSHIQGNGFVSVFPKWRLTHSCIVGIPTSINNVIPFPDQWGEKHVAWSDVDTPGNFPPEIMASQAAWPSGEKFQTLTLKSLSHNSLFSLSICPSKHRYVQSLFYLSRM